jgi:hypothetical protein
MNKRTFSKTFGYTSLVANRPQLESGQDRRDLAVYSIPQASAFLSMPSRTMRRWFLGDRRLFKPSYHRGDSVLLSFNDVTEAYIIDVLRSHYDFSSIRLRAIVEGLRKNLKAQ